jgi:hypothetical protein
MCISIRAMKSNRAVYNWHSKIQLVIRNRYNWKESTKNVLHGIWNHGPLTGAVKCFIKINVPYELLMNFGINARCVELRPVLSSVFGPKICVRFISVELRPGLGSYYTYVYSLIHEEQTPVLHCLVISQVALFSVSSASVWAVIC